MKKTFGLLSFVFSAILLIVLLRTAWISDDAYIAFRTVDNFVNGYGLRWNIFERVQSFTSPLYVLLTSCFYYFTREIYFSTLIFQIGLTFLSVYVLYIASRKNHARFFLSFAFLICSKSFIDYSTSGLENPLAHVLIGVFYCIFLNADKPVLKEAIKLTFVASLIALTRMDLVLFVIPPYLYYCVKFWNRDALKIMSVIILASFPFWSWMLFAIVYYGFPFPNTYYAKLNTGIEKYEYYRQGAVYLLQFISRDPLAFFSLLFSAFTILINRKKAQKQIVCLAGIIAYIVYVVSIGGDFMAGRFFSVVIYASLFLLSQMDLPEKNMSRFCRIAIPSLFIATLFLPDNSFLSGKNFSVGLTETTSGIIDERGFYFPFTGLLNYEKEFYPKLFWARRAVGEQDSLENLEKAANEHSVIEEGVIGYKGYLAGPRVIIMDCMALSDPLLARLPGMYKRHWRIGHIRRFIPDGYPESLQQEANKLKDPQLAAYYSDLRLIVSGEIWDPDRWRAIWNFNLGGYNHYINFKKYRFPYAKHLRYRDIVADFKGDGMPGHFEAVDFPDSRQLLIDLEGEKTLGGLYIALPNDDQYSISFYDKKNRVVDSKIIPSMLFESTRASVFHEIALEKELRANYILLEASGKAKEDRLAFFLLTEPR